MCYTEGDEGTVAAMTTLERQASRVERYTASYETYLALPDDGRLVEWVDGEIIEYMPASESHQHIVLLIAYLLQGFVARLQLGRIYIAPFEVKLWSGGPSREPDVLYVADDSQARVEKQRVEGGPDLVVEVVSPSSLTRDRIDKFREYERAGVREYWIIDPRPFQQRADFYVRDADGLFVPVAVDGDGVYTSATLPGFRLRVAWLWQESPPDRDLALAWMLAEAPGVPDELRALYRQMAQLLG